MRRIPSAARALRRGAFVLAIALASPSLLGAIPREELMEIDRPIKLGVDKVAARLASVRASRPVVAVHLSGGSARGLAHLGVLKRLEEAGFQPDLIVTSSMGSAVGLLYAAGVPPDVIADIFLTVDFAELFTARLPTGGGIADLRGLLALTHELAGDVDIADFPTPVIAVCEDLRSMRRVLLAEGRLAAVLQAAVAIPALFEPVDVAGMALIDGAITNLAPLEPFQGMADAHIVSTAFYDRRLEPSDPFTALTMAINIAKTRPAIQDIKSFEPFLVRCDVEGFAYMGWHELREIFQRGYDACSQRLPELERYLAQRGGGLAVPQDPERQLRTAALTARWAVIKRRIEAGQRIRLDRGYGALQVHPVLLRLYRESNRLEQHNYAALSYLYEGTGGGVRVGALTDAANRHGALLDLDVALQGGLSAGVRSFVYAGDQDEMLTDPTFYHLFRSQWPLPVGDRLSVRPFLQAEIGWSPAAHDREAFAAGGLAARLAGRVAANTVGGALALFFESPDVFGPEIELLVRQRLAGPLHVRWRGLLRHSWSADDALAPSYNDFYRGLAHGAGLDSYAVMNAELVLAPERLFLTIWEAVILRKLGLSVFCDVLWEEAVSFPGLLHASMGASLQGEAALGGLLPLTTMLSVGWDVDAARAVVTVNLGAPY